MEHKAKTRLSVRGLVIANAWTKDGTVCGVAIAARDESSTPIKPGSAMSAKLLKCLNQMVTVEGVMDDSGRYPGQLEVSSVEISRNPGAGKNLAENHLKFSNAVKNKY
jgi:hypothetical protein